MARDNDGKVAYPANKGPLTMAMDERLGWIQTKLR